jgi:hypothetical protein
MKRTGKWASATQTITLCPSTKYVLKGWSKRPNQSSQCTATYYVNEQKVASSPDTPYTGWVASSGYYTSGEGGTGTVVVKITCEGDCGTGYNEMYVDDVTLGPA